MLLGVRDLEVASRESSGSKLWQNKTTPQPVEDQLREGLPDDYHDLKILFNGIPFSIISQLIHREPAGECE